MRFTAPPSRFTFSNCHSGTVMQTSGTGVGIYGIRRLQVKRCRRLDLGAVLALDCCRVPGTWSGFAPKVHVVHSKDQGLLPFVICFRFDDCRCIVCPKFRRWPYASFGDEKFKSGRRCVEILQDKLRDNVVFLIERIFS